jgi:hypothetical protein
MIKHVCRLLGDAGWQLGFVSNAMVFSLDHGTVFSLDNGMVLAA